MDTKTQILSSILISLIMAFVWIIIFCQDITTIAIGGAIAVVASIIFFVIEWREINKDHDDLNQYKGIY